MTAAHEYDVSIHSAVTVDMRPYPLIDVGPLPDACEQTLIGPAPTRPPAPGAVRSVAPLCILPPLDTATPDQISDLAANCAGDTQQANDDLWVLAGSQGHIRAICAHLGATEMALSSRDERIERLGQTTAQLSTDLRRSVGQIAIAQGLSVEAGRKAERYEQALIVTSNELYAERTKSLDLEVQLRAERQRLERESTMHHDTMRRLIVQTGALHMAGRAVDKLSAEVRVLTAALEKCERGGK